MALTGTYSRSLDDKRRVAVPKPLRDALGEPEDTTFFLAPGTSRSLDLYSIVAFERLAKRLAEATNPAKVRNFLRLFYGRAEQVEVDAQGRIRIPDRLVGLASLKNEVVLLGVHDHVEIWDLQSWEDFLALHGPDFDAITARAFEQSE